MPLHPENDFPCCAQTQPQTPSGETAPETERGGEAPTVPVERTGSRPAVQDAVNHPAHYTAHPSGVECITITEHMGFNVGNAVKYLWRADEKGSALEDLQKAAWYVSREIEKRLREVGAALDSLPPIAQQRQPHDERRCVGCGRANPPDGCCS